MDNEYCSDDDKVICNREAVGAWEKFKAYRIDRGRPTPSPFTRAALAWRARMKASRTSPQNSTSTMTTCQSQPHTLPALDPNPAPRAGSSGVVCDRDSVGEWEKFQVYSLEFDSPIFGTISVTSAEYGSNCACKASDYDWSTIPYCDQDSFRCCVMRSSSTPCSESSLSDSGETINGYPICQPSTDQTAALKRACDGQTGTCSYYINQVAIGDPAAGCQKTYKYAWSCVQDFEYGGASEAQTLPDNKGCWEVTSKEECCGFLDGRDPATDPDYGGQPCVWRELGFAPTNDVDPSRQCDVATAVQGEPNECGMATGALPLGGSVSCDATHEELVGTDVLETTYSGSTDAEKDSSCCGKCADEPACEYWVRATGTDNRCWLKRAYAYSLDSSSRRGGFYRHTFEVGAPADWKTIRLDCPLNLPAEGVKVALKGGQHGKFCRSSYSCKASDYTWSTIHYCDQDSSKCCVMRSPGDFCATQHTVEVPKILSYPDVTCPAGYNDVTSADECNRVAVANGTPSARCVPRPPARASVCRTLSRRATPLAPDAAL